jgi:undecaprenyl pyrophosphate phosphatase UppP
MSVIHVIVLAIIQGLAELLPVSSSAHVVVAEKLMGLDPSAPALTLLLVLLHSGTMCAVIVYFWRRWQQTYFAAGSSYSRMAGLRTLRPQGRKALTCLAFAGPAETSENGLSREARSHEEDPF